MSLTTRFFGVIILPQKQISSLISCKRGYFQGKPCNCVTLMNNIIASTKSSYQEKPDEWLMREAMENV